MAAGVEASAADARAELDRALFAVPKKLSRDERELREALGVA